MEQESTSKVVWQLNVKSVLNYFLEKSLKQFYFFILFEEKQYW